MNKNLQKYLGILRKSKKMKIVEGKKDKLALSKLGCVNIICLKGPIYKFCEDISVNQKKVIILTDLDNEGKRLYSKLKINLEKNGVKIDNQFREFLFKETKLTQIEGLASYIENTK